ncbi:uncharacterized protein EDB91DRAFT_1095255 [Suillus paluster]|uniref:uncharacterized protein n=1 Tax=Suillus paluster TaxID=48578 RepID=UPI001B86A3E8|nr:uncharacterized protein EDB91DRAFT_1095255 [Suillus paluster]KAG1754731.1 hypothetical protein EDB91DRAFT_1095255 [Suillus paluster]
MTKLCLTVVIALLRCSIVENFAPLRKLVFGWGLWKKRELLLPSLYKVSEDRGIFLCDKARLVCSKEHQMADAPVFSHLRTRPKSLLGPQ